MDPREKRIFEKALGEFNKATDIELIPQTEVSGEPGDPSAYLRIAPRGKGGEFAVDVKLTVTRASIGIIEQELNRFQKKGLLVTQYVTASIADLLRMMEIQFIDAAGNAYVNAPSLYVFIKGNKPQKKLTRSVLHKPFRPAGLKVIFTLLCSPGMEKNPLRDIAQAAGTSLGSAAAVMKSLEKTGYLIDIPKRVRKLVKKDSLLTRWLTAYPEQLRAKQLFGTYRAEDNLWWQNTDIRDFGALWGGETAAAILTNYLRPEMITIYTKQPVGKLLFKKRLKKDLNGNIEIIKKFWNFEDVRLQNDIVPPILIYADLMASGDSRNIEAARMIYDREISRFVSED